MAVIEDVRSLGAELERSYQVYVRGRLKFRVGQIVYVAFSLDESVMGFAFPKEERAALVAASRTSSRCHRRRTCASTGSTPTSRHWTRPRPASSSSTLGAWSSPRRSPAPTISPIPTARAEALSGSDQLAVFGNERRLRRPYATPCNHRLSAVTEQPADVPAVRCLVTSSGSGEARKGAA